MLKGIHCIQSGSIAACCMDSTSFNLDTLPHAACNPLHSLGMHFPTLHGIQCIQSCCIESTAFNQCPLGHAAWNPLHSIRIHWAMVHGSHCIQSGSIALHCMESTAFHMIHWAKLHANHRINLGCISHCCMESSAFHPTARTPMPSIGINYTKLHGIHFIQSRYIAPDRKSVV